MRVEAAGATAVGLLRVPCVRRAVGAEEELRVARNRRLDQRFAVLFALQYRQAVVVRPDAAQEQRIAVHQQVVGRDGGPDVRPGHLHVLHRVARGDVLDHHLEVREPFHERAQRHLEEGLFTVEDVDLRGGDFAVDEQGDAEFLHLFQRMEATRQAGDAGVRVRGGPRRVELHAVDPAGELCPRDLLGRRVVGQVQRHQGLEARVLGQRGEDQFPVVERTLGRRDRGLQVRHDDCTTETPRSMREHGRQAVALAQVEVPVVRAGQGDRIHGGACSRRVR